MNASLLFRPSNSSLWQTRFWGLAVLAFLFGCEAPPEKIASDRSEHTEISVASAVHKGDTLKVVVRFLMDPHWHIYWKNPGDAGLAPKFEWDIAGLKPGVLHWPVPYSFGKAPVVSYGMGDTVYFVQDFTVQPDYKGASGTFTATWLECKEECLPAKAQLPVRFTIEDAARPGQLWLEPANSQQPAPWNTQIRARQGDSLVLDLGPLPVSPRSAEFFPEASGWFEPSESQSLSQTPSGRWHLAIRRSGTPAQPSEIAGILRLQFTDTTETFSVLSYVISQPQTP